MKEGDTIRFTGIHGILETGKDYKVYSVSEEGVGVYTDIGLIIVSIDDCILVSIGK